MHIQTDHVADDAMNRRIFRDRKNRWRHQVGHIHGSARLGDRIYGLERRRVEIGPASLLLILTLMDQKIGAADDTDGMARIVDHRRRRDAFFREQ
jgi:hypothetical protein